MNQFTPLSHLLEEPPHEQATEYDTSRTVERVSVAAVLAILVVYLLLSWSLEDRFNQSHRGSAVANNHAETIR